MAKTARDIGRGPRAELATVNYTFAKRALIREYRGGLVSRLDLCDAHPELMRAARNVGEETRHDCPICDAPGLRRLAYVYAEELKLDNGRVWPVKDALSLAARCREGTCYVVEVCIGCSWNHLSDAFVARNAG